MGHLTQTLVFLSLLCSGFAQPTDFEYDCRGLPENFLYWWACGSYGICRGGQYAQIDCINGTSYDRRQGDCVHNSQQVTYPCNSAPDDCLLYDGPGHRYPDRNPDPIESLPPCTFYYTCSYGRYLGHQRCPEGTVYDEPQQRCLAPAQVAPPCGSRIEGEGPPFPFQGDYGDNRQVVQPQIDEYGNPDPNKWPFTNNRHQRNTNRLQRLFYRSADRATNQGQVNFNPSDFNPAVYNANEFGNGAFANAANADADAGAN